MSEDQPAVPSLGAQGAPTDASVPAQAAPCEPPAAAAPARVIKRKKKGKKTDARKKKYDPTKPKHDGRCGVGPLKLRWMAEVLVPMWVEGRRAANAMAVEKQNAYMEEIYRRCTVRWFDAFGYGLGYKDDPNVPADSEASGDEGEGSIESPLPRWDPMPQPADWDDGRRNDCFKATYEVRDLSTRACFPQAYPPRDQSLASWLRWHGKKVLVWQDEQNAKAAQDKTVDPEVDETAAMLKSIFGKGPTRQAYHLVYRTLYADRVDPIIEAEWEAVKDSGRRRAAVVQEVLLRLWDEESDELKEVVYAERERCFAAEVEAHQAFLSVEDGRLLSPEQRAECVFFFFPSVAAHGFVQRDQTDWPGA